ncbi:MAG TPA: site-specific integrase [Solirubrobacteraceae bacterium]|nr:site-specific integrase [Solirubrobacteraceae bacterium]
MVRTPKGEVLHNPTSRGFKFALRFSAAGKRRYVTLGTGEEGWSETRAQLELERVLAQVRDGTWQPYTPQVEPPREQTFHEFASAWLESITKQIRPGTVLDYENQLRVHLLPYFKDHLLSQITVEQVDRYREHKVREGVLGATSINKTITRLGQILEVAVERELIERNSAKVGGKRRKVKPPAPARTYLDRAEQIDALLSAAGQIEAQSRPDQRLPRRAMLATLVFAGLRISEMIALDWRDVDLAAGRLKVRQSKTDAGVRYIDLLPVLASELRSLKAARKPAQSDPVFPSAAGTRQCRNRVRGRVLAGAIKAANEKLEGGGLTALPDGLTLHALRRTFASVLVALGRDPAYVMYQMGHTSPTMTLGLYAKPMPDEDRARLRALVEGSDMAVSGSSAVLAASDSAAEVEALSAEMAD